MTKEFDIVIFGATGFTGRLALISVHKLCCSGKDRLKMAIAGRSKQKLQDVLENASESTGVKIDVPIIIANIEDEKSLIQLAKKTKLILNCCGPYLLYGEPVIKACISEKTHHIDVSGEPLYTERLYLNYNTSAKDQGVYIVSTCGIDCIPCDMGVLFLQDNFLGTLNSVELYVQVRTSANESTSGAIFTMGTWKSIVYHLANFFEYLRLQKQTKPVGMPICKPKLEPRILPHRVPLIKKPAIFLPSGDKPTVEKTQAYLYKTEKKRPVQVGTYMVLESYFAVLLAIIGFVISALFSQIKVTRTLLFKYPKIFSCGFMDTKEPNQELLENSEISVTLFGQGWKDKIAEPDDQVKTPVDQKIIGRVSLKNAAYHGTSVIVALCAKVILTESDKLPKSGGVYTPGQAFYKTSLIKQLNKNGMTFEVISNPPNI